MAINFHQIRGNLKVFDDILNNLQDWIQSNDLKLSDILQHLFLSSHQDLKINNLQQFDVERRYVSFVLKNWLKESRERVFDSVKKTTEKELSIFLKQLDSLHSFKDIYQHKMSADPDSEKVIEWCGGKYLDLILDQYELFDSFHAIYLMSACFNQFKTICLKQTFSKLMNSSSPRRLNFISTLIDFLTFLNTRSEQHKILDDKSFLESVKKDQGQILIALHIQLCHQYFPSLSNNQQTMTDDLLEPIRRLDQLLKCSLQNDDWSDKFQLLTKEICKRFLLPLIKIEENLEGSRKIVVVKGTVVVFSRIKPELLERMDKLKADEAQIIGLASVHIDCNLENGTWHGKNIVIVTDKIYIVSANVEWNVSGRNDYILKHGKALVIRDDGNGRAGDHGLPGESGGNVYIACNEVINAKNWTIKSNGGRGNDGQDGGDGEDGQDGPDAESKLTREQFDKMFPLPSSFCFNWFTDRKMGIALRSTISSKNFCFSSTPKDHQDILGDDYFFIRRSSNKNDPIRLTASLWKNKVMILLHDKSSRGEMGKQGGEGGKGGPGGYGGTITIQKLNGEPFVVEGLRIGEEFQSSTVSTGDRGPSGFDGKDGRCGNHGKNGQSFGDVGVIDNMNNSQLCLAAGWKMGRNYFGFQENQRFFIEFVTLSSETHLKCTHHPYTLCNLDGMKDLQYAVLRPVENFQCELTMSELILKTNRKSQKTKTMKEVVKKKAITRQSLIRHLNQVAERTSQLLLQIVCQPNQRDDDNHMWSKVLKEEAAIQSINMSSDYYTAGIRKSIDSRLQFLHQYRSSPRTTGISSTTYDINIDNHDNEMDILAQVDKSRPNQDLYSNMLMQYMASFLEPQPTFDEDNHSLIHAALGDMDDNQSPGIFYCKKENLDNYINTLASFFRDDSSLFKNEQIKILIEFGLRLSSDKKKQLGNAWEMRNMYLEKEIKERFHKSINIEILTKLEAKFKGNSLTGLFDKKALTAKDKVVLLLRRCLDDEDVKALDVNQETLEDYDKLKVLINGLNQKYTWIGVWQSTQYQSWVRDYLKFIETAELCLPELLYLTQQSNNFQIRIFENCSKEIGDYLDGPDKNEQTRWIFKDMDNLNSDNGRSRNLNQFILYKGNGIWQRLELNSTMNVYFERREQQFNKYQEYYNKKRTEDTETDLSTSFHQKLLSWAKVNRINNPKIITCIKMVNPDYGSTPDELSKLLLRHFITANEQKKLDQLVHSISMLIERVIDYNNRYIEPIFYLHIVDNLSPTRWESEFLLFEMEERMALVLNWEDRKRWREQLFKLDNKKLFLLRDSIHVAGKQVPLAQGKMERTLKMLSEKTDLTDQDFSQLSQMSPNNWFLELMSSKEADEKSLVEDNTRCVGERKTEEIISAIKEEKYGSTSPKIPEIVDNIKPILLTINEHFKLKSHEKDDKLEENVEFLVKKLGEKIYQLKNDTKLSMINDQGEFLCKFIYAVEITMNIRLRNTQQVAIMILLSSGKENNILLQVFTGEGKSLIVAALAIYQALRNKKVDVITSNNVLAKRDSSLSVKEGGLKDLYQIFNIDVAHNCSEAENERTKAYDSAVVYGELSNFQRDYLLDKCYDRNIRGDRTFNCVIVDEVDCMLLDRGNNLLYLSHDIPGMEMLESLYVFIWRKIVPTQNSLNQIKLAILYDLYGTISIDDLVFVHGPLENQIKEKESLWSHLIKTEVIDQQGRLVIEKMTDITNDKIKYSEELDPKLVYFFRNVFERERHIHIPENLLPFVDRHLDIFLENARRAMIALRADEHYVVDQDRTSMSTDLNPQVIIIDPDTGTDLTTSQWNGGLHQFLQFKEGCRLTLQSLKSVFISNVTFIKRYKNLTGLSGTLGSQLERDFLLDMYKCNYFTVPTAFPKRFTIQPAIVVKTKEEWLNTIVNETRQIVLNENRSLIIFCRKIQLVNKIYDLLSPLFQFKNIHCYKRDYEKFSLGKENKLDVGQVIVATNLAGRGTNTKITQELCDNGGLHIYLSYLPENVRIEEQAMGRSGRKGDPGSGRLILYEPGENQDKWLNNNIVELKMERNRREMQRISELSYDFFAKFKKEEQCFDLFWKHYEVLKKKLIANVKNKDIQIVEIICHNVLDQWTLWLDQFDDGGTLLETLSLGQVLCKLKTEIIDKFPKDITDLNQYRMTPGRAIEMAKHLTTRKNPDLLKASDILNSLIKSKDSYLYPAAHYYRAFIYIKCEGLRKNKNEYLQLLRTTEFLLEERIGTHMTYSAVVSQARNGINNSNQSTEAYKKQKENTVKLLWYYISSIQSILGTKCTVSSLQETGINNKDTAEKYFNSLQDQKCIVSHINYPETDSIHYIALKKIAKNYGVDLEELKTFLKDVNNLKEERMIKKELEKTVKILCTRRDLWDWLLKKGALLVPRLSERSCVAPDLKDIGSKYVLFNPTLEIIEDLETNKKLLEDLDYAKIDTAVLETVNLTHFGKFTKDTLNVIEIAENEREKIWQALIDQKILNETGSLAMDYDECKMKFKYADCPVYENAVISLVESFSVAEVIRRQWLIEDDPIRRLNIINYLPLDPYQDMLKDLEAIHILSSHAVTDDENIYLKDVVKTITTIRDEHTKIVSQKKDDCDKIDMYLKNHMAAYSSIETADISLVLTKLDILEKNYLFEQILDELNEFSIAGFNHVIKIEEKKWSNKMILRTGIILTTGVALVIVAALPYIYLQANGSIVGKGLSFLLKKGIGNAIFAISALVSGDHVTWSDVTHRLFTSDLQYTQEDVEPFWNDAKQRFTNFFEYGFKLVGPDFQQRKFSNTEDKILARKSCFAMIKQTKTIERLHGQVDSIVNGVLKITCSNVKDKLDKEIEKVIDKKFSSTEMKEMLDKIYQFEDPDVAEYFITKQVNRVTAKWAETVQSWLLSKGVISIIDLKFDDKVLDKDYRATIETGVKSQSQELAKDIVMSVKKLIDQVNVINVLARQTEILCEELDAKLRSIIPTTLALNSVDVTKSKDFQNKIKNYTKNTIKEQANKRMEWWTNKLLEKATKHVEILTNQSAERVYQNGVNSFSNANIIGWVSKKEQGLLKKENTIFEKVVHPSCHTQLCLKLMKETNDPMLLAALIKEGSIPHDDPFCENGLQNLLQFIQNKLPHLTTIDSIKSSDEASSLIENVSSISCAIRQGWREFTQKKCPFELFPVLKYGCTDATCELRGLTEYPGYHIYVKQAFNGKSKEDSYNNMRKIFLDREDYQFVIWQIIKTFFFTHCKTIEKQRAEKEIH